MEERQRERGNEKLRKQLERASEETAAVKAATRCEYVSFNRRNTSIADRA